MGNALCCLSPRNKQQLIIQSEIIPENGKIFEKISNKGLIFSQSSNLINTHLLDNQFGNNKSTNYNMQNEPRNALINPLPDIVIMKPKKN